MDILNTPIDYLKGVGPQRANLLKDELNICTYLDLLEHYPFRYIDRSKTYNISQLSQDMPYIQIRGSVIRFEEKGIRNKKYEN